DILFKELGASLGVVGLTALFHLPWNLKFLWGPFVDQYETKRRWLIGVEVLLTVALVLVALVASAGAWLVALATLFTILGFLAATHDIAIDGFYLEALDEAGQSKLVGYRAMAFRMATMLLTGPGLVAIGWVGWSTGLMVLAACMGLITLLHVAVLPRHEPRREPISALGRRLLSFRIFALGVVIAGLILLERRLAVLGRLVSALTGAVPALGKIGLGGAIALALLLVLLLLLPLRRVVAARMTSSESGYSQAFVSFLDQPKVGAILAFVILFRTGESFLMKMKWPFFDDALHLPLEHYGFANGTLGLVASFSATLLGGYLIGRHGLRRYIWPFVIAQNLLNLLYVGLAAGWFGASPGLAAVTTVITLERIGEGLGTAVFMVYLMRCCSPEHKAAHMAILTALMSLGFTLAGAVSGFIATRLGYASYFFFSFCATLPGMALIFVVPHLDHRHDAASS
ncbi:MAG: MFS transporter, partial [Myxococcales bacterium]|nr:MFS transporter [Myxococcales bacterium]